MYAFFMMIKATFWVSIPKIPKSDKWSIFFRVNSSIQTNVRRDTNLGASISHLIMKGGVHQKSTLIYNFM